MKLILSVSTVSEASAASEKAKNMGLTHRGYGRYMNKRGMITHVTKEGKLVKLKTPVKASPKKVKVTNDDKHKSSGKVRNNSFYRMTGDPQLKDMVPTGALLEKHKDAIINDTASKAHDQWAADYKASNGKDVTRVKKTKDADWIKKNGSDEVDIANTKFDDLPNDWKKENLRVLSRHMRRYTRCTPATQIPTDGHRHTTWIRRHLLYTMTGLGVMVVGHQTTRSSHLISCRLRSRIKTDPLLILPCAPMPCAPTTPM